MKRKSIKNKAKISLSRLIVSSLVFIIVFQALLFVINTILTGSSKKIIEAIYTSAVKATSNKSIQLERKMVNYWGNVEFMNQVMKRASELYNTTKSDTLELRYRLSEDMIEMMNNMEASGTILIMESKKGEEMLYFKDANSEMKLVDSSDVTLVAGASAIARKLGIATDSSWKIHMMPDEILPYQRYKEIVKKITKEIEETHNRDLGVWEATKTVEGDYVWHFIRPLIDYTNFRCYGMVISEVNLKLVENLFHVDEIANMQNNAMLLMKKSEEEGEGEIENYDALAIKGLYIEKNIPKMQIAFSNQSEKYSFVEEIEKKTNIYSLKLNNGEKFAAIRKAIRSKNLCRGASEYYIFSIMNQKEIEQNARQFTNRVVIILLISLVFGGFFTIFVAKKITKGVEKISSDIEKGKVTRNICIRETNILELDNLAEIINGLSDRLTKASIKFQEIMSISNIAISIFEIDKKNEKVYKVGKLSGIFAGFIEEEEFEDNISMEEYNRYQALVLENAELIHEYFDEETKAYIKIFKKNWEGKERYIKIFNNVLEEESDASDGTRIVVLQDNTDEMKEQIRIKKQRDLDILTGLLNRLSFRERVEKFLNQEEKKKAAMIMWDLDELKFVNDTYGHEKGDEYLIQMANALKKYFGEESFIARISGDEFFAFLEYKKDKQEIRTKLLKLRGELDNMNLSFAAEKLSIKATVGVAWYPEDSSVYDELVKFADFSMYVGKHGKKGTITEFDREEYDRNYILLSGNQYFDNFITNRKVRYAFQPIVDAKTGEVFAYEALMRSTMEELSNVGQILKFAKKEGKLQEIEVITFEEVLRYVSENLEKFEDKKIFINSISNVVLPESVWNQNIVRYSELLKRCVIEITEQEDIEEKSLKIKQNKRREIGFQMAIDDYGSGYSNQFWFLQIHPEYVKIDMMLIRGIDKDRERQTIINNILDYTKKMGIKVICEGVETAEELETLMQMGVDYVQGYYIAKPMFELVEIREEIKKEIKRKKKLIKK